MRHVGLGRILNPRGRIHAFQDRFRPKRARDVICVRLHLAHHPVRQDRHPAVRPHQHQDNRGQFRRPLRAGFHFRGGQDFGEDVQLVAADRVGDQHLIAEILGRDEGLVRKRVLG